MHLISYGQTIFKLSYNTNRGLPIMTVVLSNIASIMSHFHLHQLSQIIRESPRYKLNLSHMDLRIQRKVQYIFLHLFLLLLGKFWIFTCNSFLWLSFIFTPFWGVQKRYLNTFSLIQFSQVGISALPIVGHLC